MSHLSAQFTEEEYKYKYPFHWRQMIGYYIVSVSIICYATAVAKVISVWGGTGVAATDPVFTFLKTDLLLTLVAVFELAIGTALLLLKNQVMKLWLIVWLSILFVAYRIGLLLVGYAGPCTCLGKPQSWLHFASFVPLDAIMMGALIYMLGGGCLLLFIALRAIKYTEGPNSV